MESFAKSPKVESEPGAYDREAVAEQALSEARKLLAERLDLETSTSSERITVLNELIENMRTPPIDNSKRHVFESLSIMLGLEELIQPLEEYKAKHPELEAS